MDLFLILTGIIFTSTGLFFLIIYLNLFSLGYNFLEFFQYIIRRYEIWLILLGLFLILIGLGRSKRSELLLRHKTKFSRR